MKELIADFLFYFGNKMIEWSALLAGYDDMAREIRKNRLDAWKNRKWR
jgi:hypothetical protein